jgi:hypothetical protein
LEERSADIKPRVTKVREGIVGKTGNEIICKKIKIKNAKRGAKRLLTSETKMVATHSDCN